MNHNAAKQLARVLLPLLIAIILGVFVYLIYGERGYDDPYITYRYAENIHAGVGFVYNPGVRELSTTTPLFALLLASFRFLTPNLPQVANLIGVISLAAGGLILWEIAHWVGRPFAGWTALLIYSLSPLLIITIGSETALYLALCLATIYLYLRQNFKLAAVVMALAILTRADAALLAVILSADWLAQTWLRITRRAPAQSVSVPWMALLLGAGILLIWACWATLYFGSPLPVTLEVKRAQGLMQISELFAPSFLNVVRWYFPVHQLQTFIFFLGVALVWRGRAWLILLIWAVLYFLAYTLLGVTRYFWYYAPLLPGMVGMISLGLDAVQRISLPVRAGRRLPAWLASLTLAGLVLAQITYLTGPRFSPDPRLTAYRMTGEWLAVNTPENASVAALEIGIIGYYAQRSMVDFAGLIQPEVAQVFAPTTTYQDSAVWAFQQYRPDYVILQAGLLPRFERNEVSPACAVVHTLPASLTGYSFDLNIYQCPYP